MKSRVQIRAARPPDVPLLLPLIEQYWRFEHIDGFDPARITPVLTRVLSDMRLGRAWIAYDGDVAAGYLLGVFVFSLEYQGLTAIIDELFVLPDHRSLGLGRRLLEVAETQFRGQGCTSVSLELGRANVIARAFYASLGYEHRAGFELLNKNLT